MRDQKELHSAYIKKPHRELGSPTTMPVQPLHRANRSIHKRFKVITNPVHRGYGEARYPLDLHKEDTSTFDCTQTTETNPQLPNQPINPMPPHQYPNGQLDPNINIDLQRNQRQRRPPNRYNPQNGR